MKTTLNKIKAHDPWIWHWYDLTRKLNKTEGDDEPLSMLTILDMTHPLDVGLPLWCLRAVDGYDEEIRAFTLWCRRLAFPDETFESMDKLPFDVQRLVEGAMSDLSCNAYRESIINPDKDDLVRYKRNYFMTTDVYVYLNSAPWVKASDLAWGTARASIKEELRRVLTEIEGVEE